MTPVPLPEPGEHGPDDGDAHGNVGPDGKPLVNPDGTPYIEGVYDDDEGD